MGREGNTPKSLHIHRILSLIGAELELLNSKITHLERFNLLVPTEFKLDLYILPESKELGIIGIAEVILTLFLPGKVVGENGKPVPKIQLAREFEQLLNLKFGSIYGKIDEVFTRKLCNLAKASDALRNAITREGHKHRNK